MTVSVVAGSKGRPASNTVVGTVAAGTAPGAFGIAIGPPTVVNPDGVFGDGFE